jgi:FAD:protein FMN transferase
MKIGVAILCGGLLFSTLSNAAEPALQRFEFAEAHMGTKFRVVLYAADEQAATKAAKVAFARVAELNRIMTDYDPSSELMRLCQSKAGVAVKVSPELFFVLSKGQEVARQSDGMFDMTVGPLVKLWRLSRLTQRLPDEKELADAKARTGYKHLELNEKDRSVRLLVPGMQLDLGGIAKGYAADEILAVLNKHGIARVMAAAGGDIVVGDPPADADGWNIDVAPLTKAKPSLALRLKNGAVSTSGDKEQFTLINGVRYSHIVDPRTGLGQTGRRMVTVIAPKGILADSMTKAVALLEPDKAMKLIEKTEGAAALVVIESVNGELVRESTRLAIFLVKPRRP